MKRKKGIMLSYTAPDRDFVWFDPAMNVLKNFDNGIWKPIATNLSYAKVEKLIIEQMELNLKLTHLEQQTEQMKNTFESVVEKLPTHIELCGEDLMPIPSFSCKNGAVFTYGGWQVDESKIIDVDETSKYVIIFTTELYPNSIRKEILVYELNEQPYLWSFSEYHYAKYSEETRKWEYCPEWILRSFDLDLRTISNKPEGGWTKYDFSADVQKSLENANNALVKNNNVYEVEMDALGFGPDNSIKMDTVALWGVGEMLQLNKPLAVPNIYFGENNKENLMTELSKKANSSDLNFKQDRLVSGTNIKTINGESLLGSGNIAIQSGDMSDYYTKEAVDAKIEVLQGITAHIQTAKADKDEVEPLFDDVRELEDHKANTVTVTFQDGDELTVTGKDLFSFGPYTVPQYRLVDVDDDEYEYGTGRYIVFCLIDVQGASVEEMLRTYAIYKEQEDAPQTFSFCCMYDWGDYDSIPDWVLRSFNDDLRNNISTVQSGLSSVQSDLESVQTAVSTDCTKYCLFSDIDTLLGSTPSEVKSALYNQSSLRYIVRLRKTGNRFFPVGIIEMFFDSMEHCVTQIFRTNYNITAAGLIDPNSHSHILREYVRYYNVNWTTEKDYYGDPWPVGTWTLWREHNNTEIPMNMEVVYEDDTTETFVIYGKKVVED